MSEANCEQSECKRFSVCCMSQAIQCSQAKGAQVALLKQIQIHSTDLATRETEEM